MQQTRPAKPLIKQTPQRVSQRPPLPALNFPEQLPVSGKREEIAAAIAGNRVVIVCGETGSGKTTQLPKIAWEAGRGRNGLIGHTQPRRLAATSVAKRIAQELKSAPGEYVGYKIRFNEQITPGATIKLMTDGVLLAETLSDPHLNAYDTLIVDEAHERSLNIDFLLGYLKQLLDGPRRDTLKLIITSATIDAQRFAEHFGEPDKPAPVIEVSGRLFPVEIRYQPLNLPTKAGLNSQAKKSAIPASKPGTTDEEPEAESDEVEQTLPSAIADAAAMLWREGPGDILVFLPGEREIRDAMEYLRKWNLKSSASRAAAGPPLEALALFSRLSAADQERVFSQSKGRRIVLATNVAETSLTVPGVRYVIDAGLSRMKRYRYRTKVEQLQVEKISQAAANQRAGRCGRVADGICIRLYAEDDYLKRPRFTDPEVLRSSLAAVILRMKALRLSDIEDFPFLDLPPRRAILDGYALLQELQALDDSRAVTAIGKQLAKLPLDPRIARMLLAAHELHCLPEVLIIASGLSVQDPRERPMEAAQAADQKHLRFVDEKSDFVALLKVWRYWRSGEGNKESNRIFQEQLKREFISPRRLREWADVHSQLRETVQELGWIEPSKATKKDGVAPEKGGTVINSLAALWDKPLDAVQYEKIHRALLAGLLGNLGLKGHESNVYLGTHEIKFQIHPGSGLAKKGGRWLMASELVDTHKLYARNVAQVQPEWIESAAGHLIRRSCSDAHWEKKAGQVMAVERGVLYGLPIYSQRRVHFGPINPELSRELMIRGALVALDWESDLSFFKHNQRLIADIESLEHKIRRPDLLVDEQLLYAFFDAGVPDDVVSGQTLTLWWRKANDANLLKLSRDALMRKDVAGISSESFPRTLRVMGNDCTLDYHFDPSSVRDGVSLTVPLHLLNQVDANRCEWLVPGMLKDKVLALIKSLPPKLRHRLLPFDAFAVQFIQKHENYFKAMDTASGVTSLIDAIRDAVKEAIHLPVLPTDFRAETLANHAWMRFVVVDEHQRELAASRDLSALRAQLGGQAQSQFREQLLQAQNQKRSDVQDSVVVANPAANPVAKNAEISVEKNVAKNVTNKAPSALPLSTSTVYVDWTFGELEELIETRGAKGERLIGYPGLVAVAAGVVLQVFDDPAQARKEHLNGLRRLFAIQFKEQIKFFERHVPGLRDMTIQFLALGSAEELKQQLVDIVLDRICLVDPLPVDAASFVARCEQSRGRIGLLAQEVGRLAASILTEYVAVQKKLVGIKAQQLPFADIDSSVKRLCHKRFLIETPWANLSHLPRYLKAAQLRIDKLRADPSRDSAQMGIINPLQTQWIRAIANQRGAAHSRLEEYRWLLEELRVSLFAQELRTPVPVSAKRLEKVWQSLQN